MRKFSIVSDVISLLISVVDIKYDHSFSWLDQKKLVGIKIKMKLLTFLFRYKTASATGLGGWISLLGLTVFSRGSKFPPLSKNVDRLLSVDLF